MGSFHTRLVCIPREASSLCSCQEVFSPKAVVDHLNLASHFWKPEPTENDGRSVSLGDPKTVSTVCLPTFPNWLLENLYDKTSLFWRVKHLKFPASCIEPLHTTSLRTGVLGVFLINGALVPPGRGFKRCWWQSTGDCRWHTWATGRCALDFFQIWLAIRAKSLPLQWWHCGSFRGSTQKKLRLAGIGELDGTLGDVLGMSGRWLYVVFRLVGKDFQTPHLWPKLHP